jgi:hypothetical protein
MTMNWAAAMSPRASQRLLLGAPDGAPNGAADGAPDGAVEGEVDDMVSPFCLANGRIRLWVGERHSGLCPVAVAALFRRERGGSQSR